MKRKLHIIGFDLAGPGPSETMVALVRRHGKSRLIQEVMRFSEWRRRNRYWVDVTATLNALCDSWGFMRMRPARAKHVRKLSRYQARALGMGV
ncbi:hypothetical protein [Pseudomonas proteolytica]|uniref:hypothetical protein n=1 Tax=Pseudomonas proteolytica TaxID=219574 RepID=UPI00147531FE|nr:hypothetical protein [Pseudomonas proteolytica]NMZ37071.1 hypothetical protein [Pseudomonas proteolytica]